MRDIALFLFIFSMLPLCFKKPYIGLLFWTWISYMLPQKLTWGFAYDFRFVYIIALATMAGMVLQKNVTTKIPMQFSVLLLVSFTLWTCFTTWMAAYPDAAYQEWIRFMKIQIMVIVTLMLVHSRKDLHLLVMVIALSLGFWGVKGGLWTLLHGGINRVYGPAGSFFYDNNTLALTMNMTVPLLWYLFIHSKNIFMRTFMVSSMLLTISAILGTYSRGGLLGGLAMLMILWLKNRRRIFGTIIVAFFMLMVYNFMPPKWQNRMHTIMSTYEYQASNFASPSANNTDEEHFFVFEAPPEEKSSWMSISELFEIIKNPNLDDPNLDRSVSGRLNAWNFVYNMIQDYPWTGGGFQVFSRGYMYWEYGRGSFYNDAHNIYFEVLAEQGIPGLVLFLWLYANVFLLASRTNRLCKHHPEVQWASDLSSMIQASIVGYLVTGMTLGMAYFDLPYHLLSIVILAHSIALREIRQIHQKQPNSENKYVPPDHSIFTPSAPPIMETDKPSRQGIFS